MLTNKRTLFLVNNTLKEYPKILYISSKMYKIKIIIGYGGIHKWRIGYTQKSLLVNLVNGSLSSKKLVCSYIHF